MSAPCHHPSMCWKVVSITFNTDVNDASPLKIVMVCDNCDKTTTFYPEVTR